VSKIVNGSSEQPLSGQAPRQIVLLLHGFGSNGADLISLRRNGNRSCPMRWSWPPMRRNDACIGEGYQWWALSELNPAAMTAGAASAAPAIDAFIDRKLAQYGLTEDNLAIVGFSQGTMMALHVGLRRQRQVASIVGYSGMLTGAQELAHVPIRKPPVLLVHGDADPIVPVSALHYAQTELERQGVPVTSHVSRGLGHSVDETGLRLGQDFIARGWPLMSQDYDHGQRDGLRWPWRCWLPRSKNGQPNWGKPVVPHQSQP
jgi:phospholipase/carboxylesterase